ncbi:TPA: transpeptidase-transglycosylase [Burkholderia cenocepacia]|uniref:transpeptidase-transglycosylase n=1 Tax=Burkholderia cenocepacia TaxID=95486 RepID=UPI002012625D|nr:transpeptidase-transglycosylase [Burkholderia cenocepacia]
MLHEDRWFRWHPGFNPYGLACGAWITYVRGGQDAIDRALAASRNRLYARWQTKHPGDASLKPLSALPFDAPHAVDQALAARNDTRDMGVKARVGPANFFDRSIDGQVNGTRARRSPGSGLQPFVYAPGFDRGVLHPDCCDAGQVEGDPPRVTSSLRGSPYAMRVKRTDETRIAFNAIAYALYGFVNDAYVGRSAPGDALFWQPRTAGSYTVRVVDDHGRSDQRPPGVGLEQ